MIITFETSITASNITGNIATFYTTHDFQSNNLIILATCNTAKDNWYSAGWLSQIYLSGSKDIVVKKLKIDLNEYQLFKCVMIDPVESFKLKINPENWLKDLTLNFWSTASEFSDIQIDFNFN